MEINKLFNNYSDENPIVELIFGDMYEGIAVSDYTDRIYQGKKNGKLVRVIQKSVQIKPDCLCVGFLFLLDEPQRFRVDVLVPENCTNAQVALQDKELVGFFSPDIPEDAEPVLTTKCNDANKVSTLHPGEFQSINFKWESGDVLKFYFYFGDYKKA